MMGLLAFLGFIIAMVVVGVFVITLLEWIEENKKGWNGNVVFHVVAYGVAIVFVVIAWLVLD